MVKFYLIFSSWTIIFLGYEAVVLSASGTKVYWMNLAHVFII